MSAVTYSFAKLNNGHRRQGWASNLPSNIDERFVMISERYTPLIKKRKVVYEDEEEEKQTQTLTLTPKHPCVKRKSSSSKHYSSNQSYYSNQKHTKQKNRSWNSPSMHVNRKWSYSDHESSGFGDKLILVSYNILGVENASRHPDLYYKVPFQFIKWDHRLTAICKELAQYNPSILCFQEVDCFNDLHDALTQDGFKGVLKARTGDAEDGCAIFWKYERFQLLHEESIEFQRFGLGNNVAQFCVLKVNDDGLSKPTNLVVGNIHVLFNPRRGDIKLGQIRLFLERAHRLSEEWGGIPVVLAGDFNCVPQSAAYQYLSSAKLDILQHDRTNIAGQLRIPLYRSYYTKTPFRDWKVRKKPWTYRWNDGELELATGNKGVTCLQHSLKLRSAYLGVPGNVTTRDNLGEPLATSCHSKFMGTVDYIWHSDQLVPVRVLETLTRDALEKLGGLPSQKWGSDHLALACEFSFASREE